MTHVLERFRLGRYVMLRLDGEHPLFPGKTLEYEHRVVVAEQLGRPLDEKEVVHHERETWNNDPKHFLSLKRARESTYAIIIEGLVLLRLGLRSVSQIVVEKRPTRSAARSEMRTAERFDPRSSRPRLAQR